LSTLQGMLLKLRSPLKALKVIFNKYIRKDTYQRLVNSV